MAAVALRAWIVPPSHGKLLLEIPPRASQGPDPGCGVLVNALNLRNPQAPFHPVLQGFAAESVNPQKKVFRK